MWTRQNGSILSNLSFPPASHRARRANAENRHISLVGQPVTLSRTPSKMAARPPEFGEQTEEVLTEFGFTKDEIGSLRQNKVV